MRIAKLFTVSRAALLAVLGFPAATAMAADLQGAPPDGAGFHAGSFWYLADFEFGGFFDSNIFATPDDPTGAGGGYILSNLQAKSDWGRHGLEVNFFGDHYQYVDQDEMSRSDAGLNVKGYVDVTHDFVINGGAGLRYDQLAPGDIDAPLTAEEPTPRAEARSWAEATKQFNRLFVSFGADVEAQEFNNVESRFFDILIDTDGLDGFRWSAGGRLGYEISPGYRLFGDVRYNQERWQRSFGDNTDSQGVQALGGVAFEITRLITGEASIGYFAQDFDNPDFQDPHGFDYHAALFWNPTPLMRVQLAADRTIEPTSIDEIGGAVRDQVALRVDYEVTHAFTLAPQFRYYTQDYIDSDAKDDNPPEVSDSGWEAGVTADYALNRFWSVGAHYTFDNRDAEVNNEDLGYQRHFVGVYAKAHL